MLLCYFATLLLPTYYLLLTTCYYCLGVERDAAWIESSGLSFDKAGRAVVLGRVVVAKAPCHHPGDVRILSAVDRPELRPNPNPSPNPNPNLHPPQPEPCP